MRRSFRDQGIGASSRLVVSSHVVLRRLRWWAALFFAYQAALTRHASQWPAAVARDVEPLRSALWSTTDLSRAFRAEHAPRLGGSPELERAVRGVPICIVWKQVWAGELGASILYRIKSHRPDQVDVGYFVFWSSERPWGDNEQTRWVLPALLIDAFYTRTLFLLPGLQQAMYGAGDIEGARVTYRIAEDRLTPTSIIVDDTSHRETSMDVHRAVDANGRVMLFSDAWSHQLAGRDAVGAVQSGAWLRCYLGAALRPLTREVASNFRLGSPEHPRRAKPAWRF